MKELSISLRNIVKKIIITIFILIIISSSWIFIKPLTFLSTYLKNFEFERNPISADIKNTTQWVKNPSFDSGIEYWTPSFTGDSSDVNASINSGQANFEILGDKRTFTLIADPPLALDWFECDNPNYPNRPEEYGITTQGCRVHHLYDDQTAVTNPSIHWDKNISLNVDMSDYIITSASINVIVYANASLDIDREGDTEARNDLRRSLETYDLGDYVRFYVLISDLEKDRVYEMAYLQPTDLGAGNPPGGPPGEDIMPDTYMLSYPKEDLIFYLSSALNTDNSNFTLTLGMLLHFEDNIISDWDYDEFNELIIKFVNFTFTYEKKINRYTSISWNQKGNPLSGDNIKVVDATLNFKYKVDQNWSKSLSPNSELKILINNNEILKHIKLTDMNTTFQEFNLGVDDIKSYILPDINFSFSVLIFLADEFALDQIITFSIDDVYLTIFYIIYTKESLPYYLIWIILSILFGIIAILTCLSLRSYFFIPHKMKKKNSLLLRTQKFKDADNIQGILLIHSESGLPMFTRNYSDIMENKNTLFSGFIQAISVVSDEISNKKSYKAKSTESGPELSPKKINELDFKHFFCLILDVEEIRSVLILKNKSSKRLKQQMFNFTLDVYLKNAEILKDWDHNLQVFKVQIPPLLNKYFDLYYKDFFKIAIEQSELQRIKKETNLSKQEYRMINILFNYSQEKGIFKLMTLLEEIGEKNEDLVIDTLEALINHKLIIPISD
ncbi:MAG: hypothetical protein ACFE91_03515 [Promethearchaeota archaeon]